MKELEEIYVEDKGLRAVTVVYFAVLMVAFIIGLYGLFSLFWLATSAAQRASLIG
ncbi:MAG TPA: hypothetical protein VNN73_04040 [Blastocatellia bacterium]|nr:hypothetical protein [Blastocatellia bacterium]